MTLKDRIVRVLKKKKLDYSNLCEQLELTNDEVDSLIEEKNVKILESISKLLGIPLYSFYNNPNDTPPSAPTKRHYKEDIWKDDNDKI
jgi:hypothetical protein